MIPAASYIHDPIRISQELAHALGTDRDVVSDALSAHVAALTLGHIDEATFWKLARRDFGIRLVAPGEHLLNCGFVLPAAGPKPAVFAIRDRLRKLGLKIAVCSNTIAAHAVPLRRNGVYSGFDTVVLSCDVGLKKPEPEIFQLTLDRLGVQAGDAIFIDDLVDNVDAARKLGMHAVRFTTAAALETQLRQLLPHY